MYDATTHADMMTAAGLAEDSEKARLFVDGLSPSRWDNLKQCVLAIAASDVADDGCLLRNVDELVNSDIGDLEDWVRQAQIAQATPDGRIAIGEVVRFAKYNCDRILAALAISNKTVPTGITAMREAIAASEGEQ